MPYAKKGDVVTRSIAGETLLVPIRDKLADMEQLIVLDGTGAFIWEKIDGRATIKEICDALMADYEVDEQQAKNDVSEFIAQLKEADLIEEKT